jgi:hypothetical protein
LLPRRAAVSFAAFAADELHAVIRERHTPTNFPSAVEAAKLAIHGLHVGAITIDERSAARAGAPFVAFAFGERRVPEFFPVRGSDHVSDFLSVLFIEIKKLAVRNHRRGKAGPTAIFQTGFSSFGREVIGGEPTEVCASRFSPRHCGQSPAASCPAKDKAAAQSASDLNREV